MRRRQALFVGKNLPASSGFNYTINMTCLNPGPSTKISATVLQYSSVGGWDCMQMPILLFLNLYVCRMQHAYAVCGLLIFFLVASHLSGGHAEHDGLQGLPGQGHLRRLHWQ